MDNSIKIILIVIVVFMIFGCSCSCKKVEKFTDDCTSLDNEYEDWECDEYDDENNGYDSLQHCLNDVDNDEDNEWCNNCNRINNKLEENSCYDEDDATSTPIPAPAPEKPKKKSDQAEKYKDCKCINDGKKFNYCSEWTKNNEPWCYTKNNCGEAGDGGYYKYCKKPKSCTNNSSGCGDGTYCHSDKPKCLQKFKDNDYSYEGINSNDGSPCNVGLYCKPYCSKDSECTYEKGKSKCILYKDDGKTRGECISQNKYDEVMKKVDKQPCNLRIYPKKSCTKYLECKVDPLWAKLGSTTGDCKKYKM